MIHKPLVGCSVFAVSILDRSRSPSTGLLIPEQMFAPKRAERSVDKASTHQGLIAPSLLTPAGLV